MTHMFLIYWHSHKLYQVLNKIHRFYDCMNHIGGLFFTMHIRAIYMTTYCWYIITSGY